MNISGKGHFHSLKVFPEVRYDVLLIIVHEGRFHDFFGLGIFTFVGCLFVSM